MSRQGSREVKEGKIGKKSVSRIPILIPASDAHTSDPNSIPSKSSNFALRIDPADDSASLPLGVLAPFLFDEGE